MVYFYFLLFLIGLAVGSFVSTIVFRLPKGEQFVGGRSYCPSCKHRISWYDLIPLFSFLVLRGRCRYCRGKISLTYPFIEISSGIIFLVSFFLLSSSGLIYWLFWVFVLELFLILALIDFKLFLLPDSVMTVILVSFAGYGVLTGQSGYLFSFSNLINAAFWFLVFFMIWSFSNGRGMGLGDAKLAGLVGFIFGFWDSFFIFYLAVIAGVFIGLILILKGKGNLKTKLPLGTLISFSVIFFTLFGHSISGKVSEFFKYLLFRVDLF